MSRGEWARKFSDEKSKATASIQTSKDEIENPLPPRRVCDPAANWPTSEQRAGKEESASKRSEIYIYYDSQKTPYCCFTPDDL